MKPFYSCWSLLCAALLLLAGSCAPTPVKPTTVRVRWPHDPEALDILMLTNQQALDAANLLHLSLLQVDFPQKKFTPALAEDYPTLQLLGDSLTLLTYRLRAEATWDNGQPVLAQDVDFSLKLMYCPGIPNEAARAQYDFIRALRYDSADARRFTLVCRGQAPEYAHISGDFFILPEAALDPAGRLRRFSLAQLQKRPATAPPDSTLAALARRYQSAAPGRYPAHLPGCGPYQLASWKKDRSLTFQRKPTWWADRLKPTPFVLQAVPERLRFDIIPDDATAMLALQRGDLDVYPQVPARVFDRLRRSEAAKKTLAFYSVASYDVVTAGFNTQKPALADALTRQALRCLFDPAGLLQATQFGEGQRTVGLIHPTDRANYNDSLPLLSYNPAAAAALLQRAGWQRTPAGWQRAKQPVLSLTVRYRTDDAMFETIALQFRAAATQLGIPITLLPSESATFSTALKAGDFDMYVRTLKGSPFMFNFVPILHSQAIGASNHTRFGTPASDQLIVAVAAASNPARKARLLRKFQALLQQEAPLVPLFFLPNRVAANQALQGLHVTGLKPGYTAAAIRRTAVVATP